MISKLPTNLTQDPYNSVIWHPTQKKIIRGKTLVKNLLLYMLNHPPKDINQLSESYAKALKIETNEVELPKKVL